VEELEAALIAVQVAYRAPVVSVKWRPGFLFLLVVFQFVVAAIGIVVLESSRLFRQEIGTTGLSSRKNASVKVNYRGSAV